MDWWVLGYFGVLLLIFGAVEFSLWVYSDPDLELDEPRDTPEQEAPARNGSDAILSEPITEGSDEDVKRNRSEDRRTTAGQEIGSQLSDW